MTLTPALSLLLLPGATTRATEPAVVTRLKRWYRGVLNRFIDRGPRATVYAAGALVIAAASFPFLGEQFLPHFKEYDFLMHWVEKPGTSLEAMRRITVLASKELRAVPGVRNFGSHIGRAEVADEVVGPNFTELWISVDPKVEYDATVARIQRTVDGYPGLYRDLLTYLRERIKEVLTGASATLVVRLYGPDLDVLRTKAQEVSNAMSGVDGLADLKVQAMVLVPQIEVRFRSDAGSRIGLTAGAVRDQIETLVPSRKVGEVYEAHRAFDVVVWGTPAVRNDVTTLRTLPIELPNGGSVPLGDVADVRFVPTPNEITRENASRRLDVTANPR